MYLQAVLTECGVFLAAGGCSFTLVSIGRSDDFLSSSLKLSYNF